MLLKFMEVILHFTFLCFCWIPEFLNLNNFPFLHFVEGAAFTCSYLSNLNYVYFWTLKNLLRYNNHYYLKDILRIFKSRSIFKIFLKFATKTDIIVFVVFTCSSRLIIIIQYLKHLKTTLFSTCKFHREFM